MPVDYSKWDAIELSDDSDIEVHPNVDKRSFIRAKQAQIHQQREQRRIQITTLKYERIINEGLIERIDNLLTALKSHKDVTREQPADELVFQALIESAGNPQKDTPPPPPPGVHQNVKEQPTYSRMMAALVDQVKTEIDKKNPDDRYNAFISEVGVHKSQVEGLQKQLLEKLADLENEEKRFITSDDIHVGFDSSHVTKPTATEKAAASAPTAELLNPNRPDITRQDSGEDADVEGNAGVENDDDIEASALAKRFAKIKSGDYRQSHQFISDHPEILKERETDGLLVEAFNSQLEGKDDYARQCVHQALLIQYCRQLGRDGVALFFKRITTPSHQAGNLFNDDVNTTYARIRDRSAAIKKERAENPTGEVEQIQLHAVDPNTQINIRVPPAIPAASPDPDQPYTAELQELADARQIFESFPPNLQKALESGSLDKVNEVLGKMSVSEAEEVVEKLGQGGMLSLEEGVIDATTEEGKQMVEQIARDGKMPGVADQEKELGEPGPVDVGDIVD